MTPLNFTAFILSLAVVDARHSLRRASYHAAVPMPPRPAWLRSLLARTQGQGREKGKEESFYHSRQRQLMRLEAAEAFQLRGPVLALLAAAAAAVLACLVYLARWFFGE